MPRHGGASDRRAAPPAGRSALAGLAVALVLAGVAAAGSGFTRLEGHGGPIKDVAVSPDGTRALTASFDYSVGIWSLGDAGTHLRWAEGHDAAVNAVAFHPDGRRALSAGDDFTMILWDLRTGRALKRFEGHRGKIMRIAIAPGGRVAATAGWDDDIGLWDLRTGAHLGWLEGHDTNVNDVVFSGDGERLYSASYDGTIRRWHVGRRAEEITLVRHGFGVNHLVVNEAAGWLAYGAVDGAVRAIALGSGRKIADLTAGRRPILALAADRTGRRLAVGDGKGYIMVIDTADWSIIRDFRAALEGPVWALAWDGTGERLVAGGIEDAAAVWPVAAEAEALFTAEDRSFLRDPAKMTNGERQFMRKCSICHTLEPDGARRAGPTLHGLFGRPAGAVAGYRYSQALAGAEIVWGPETIDRLFEEGPAHVTPGSKMPMQRIRAAEDRADLIEFLRENTGPPARDRRSGEDQ